MNDDTVYRRPTKLELALDFVKSRLFTIALLVAIAVGLYIIFDPEVVVPRWLRLVVFTTLLVGVPFSLLIGGYIKSKLYDPNYIYLVDIDARTIDGALYQFPFHDFKEVDVVDEDGYEHPEYDITELTPNLYVGRKVDLEAMTVVGTWRGTLSDRDLLRCLSKISECRGQLQDDAIRGFRIELSAFTIVRTAARTAALELVDTFKKGTLPDEGAGLDTAIDNALEESGIEKKVDQQLDIDLDPERAEERLDQLVDDPDAPDRADGPVDMTEASQND